MKYTGQDYEGRALYRTSVSCDVFHGLFSCSLLLQPLASLETQLVMFYAPISYANAMRPALNDFAMS